MPETGRPDRTRPRTDRERAEFRAWVRENHPDLGGDPEAFAAGLRRRRAGRPAGRPDRPGRRADVRIVRRRRWPVMLISRWRERRLRARHLR
ncbi:hypothetical protein [Actinomadura hibisca]|uniref:hypothetical protein n=1 Tax=Actinomadura hibisca TaxID=68565 RepID=UPI00082F6D84|nr:hypothetical protein [Actinomadura hibisca]